MGRGGCRFDASDVFVSVDMDTVDETGGPVKWGVGGGEGVRTRLTDCGRFGNCPGGQ